jgi:5-methylcytosine-specific restriction endonuclease McrA
MVSAFTPKHFTSAASLACAARAAKKALGIPEHQSVSYVGLAAALRLRHGSRAKACKALIGWYRSSAAAPAPRGPDINRLSLSAGIKLGASPLFYQSREWKELRYQALRRSRGRCECCGRSPAVHGIALHVDHVQPRSTHPHLALVLANLQVLCEACNLGKGAHDATDWRGPNR